MKGGNEEYKVGNGKVTRRSEKEKAEEGMGRTSRKGLEKQIKERVRFKRRRE